MPRAARRSIRCTNCSAQAPRNRSSPTRTGIFWSTRASTWPAPSKSCTRASIVVGDVNSNNVVVDRDSTDAPHRLRQLPDPRRGAVFRCNVGVADYQPPELQTSDLSRVDRLPQHDLFGLAVMIFQLLFVGKHPFAGVLPPTIRATGAIGDNVAARRFFYGPEAQRWSAPAAGQPDAHGGHARRSRSCFVRRSWAIRARGRAPPPGAGASTDLKTQTIACRSQCAAPPSARAALPWCALETRGLHYFSLLRRAPGRRRRRFGLAQFTDADVERMWARSPRSRARSARTAIPATKIYRTTPLGLWKAKRIAAFAAVAVVVALAVAILFATGFGGLALFVALVGMLGGLAARPDARRAFALRRKRLEESRKAHALAQREWAAVARAARFSENRARLVKVRQALKDQRRRYEAEVAALQKNRDREELKHYLESHVIAVNLIPEIDKRTKAMLLSFGLETAIDLCPETLREVPHLTRPQRVRLMLWRESLERGFRAQPRKAPDAEALRDVQMRHVRERLKNQAQLASGAGPIASNRSGHRTAPAGARATRARKRRDLPSGRSRYADHALALPDPDFFVGIASGLVVCYHPSPQALEVRTNVRKIPSFGLFGLSAVLLSACAGSPASPQGGGFPDALRSATCRGHEQPSDPRGRYRSGESLRRQSVPAIARSGYAKLRFEFERATRPLTEIGLGTPYDPSHAHTAFTTEFDNGKLDGFNNEPCKKYGELRLLLRQPGRRLAVLRDRPAVRVCRTQPAAQWSARAGPGHM